MLSPGFNKQDFILGKAVQLIDKLVDLAVERGAFAF
jgi:hypothetical protein